MRKYLPYALFLIVAILAWPIYHSWAEALTRAQWFQITEDEAFYGEVIQNLSKLGLYKSWTSSLFDPMITGGPAFLFPVYFWSKLTNLSPAIAGRLSSFVFHIGSILLFILINLRVWKEKNPKFSRPFFVAILSIAAFFQTWRALPENNYILFGFLAESSAVFYLFLFLYFFYKNNRLGAGVSASLAFLAKPYMVYVATGFLLVTLIQDFRSKHYLKLSKTVLGLAIPFILYIAYIIVHLGFMETLQYWRHYPQAVSQFSGTDLKLAPLDQLWFHLTNFNKAMSPRGMFMTLVGAVYLFYLSISRKTSKTHLAIAVFMIFHLAWWFLLSPEVRARYFIAVPVVALCYFFRVIVDQINWKKFCAGYSIKADFYLGILFFGVVLVFTFFQVQKEWNKNWNNYDSCAFCRQLYVQNEWEKFVPFTSANKYVWVATGTHEIDRGLFYTAPFAGQLIKDPKDLTFIQKGDWAAISDYSLKFFNDWVQRNCSKLIAPPGRNEGLYECKR